MNILVDLFGYFSLLVVASSLRIKESKSRGIQTPASWKRSNIDAGRSREVTENDDEYGREIADYENFHLVHDVPEVSELNRDKLHNTSEMKRDIKNTFPHQNPSLAANIEAFISSIKPYSLPGQKEMAEMNFNNLLCLTDCRMADLMVFNLVNQPRNNSHQFQNVPLAGRPYSFATMKSWCKENCGKRASWVNPNIKNDAFDGKDAEIKRQPTEKDMPQFEDEKPTASNPQISYVSLGAKPAGLLQSMPPVIPTLFFPPVRNFYPYPNIIATPMLYRTRHDRRAENTATSGVSFRSFRANPPKSVSIAEDYPRKMFHQSKHKGRSYQSSAEYKPSKNVRKLKSDVENNGKEMQHQQTDDITEKTEEKTKYDEGDDNYEDAYYEDDYDDDDDSDDERIDSVVRFLRDVSRILSNKAFRVLLKRSISCDSGRDLLPGKEPNDTDLHRRGLQ